MNRRTGAPEHVVLDLDSFRALQAFAVKGLVRELGFKAKPEDILHLLQNPISTLDDKEEKPSTSPTVPVRVEYSGTLCISGLRTNIQSYPYSIGSDEAEVDLYIPPSLSGPLPLQPVHAVIHAEPSGNYSIENFGSLRIDGVPVAPQNVTGISAGSVLSFGHGPSVTFFP